MITQTIKCIDIVVCSHKRFLFVIQFYVTLLITCGVAYVVDVVPPPRLKKNCLSGTDCY
jgi:hypothetical protein